MGPRDIFRKAAVDGGKLAREAAERLGVDKHLAPLLPDPPRPARPLHEIKAELDALIGLTDVKQQVSS